MKKIVKSLFIVFAILIMLLALYSFLFKTNNENSQSQSTQNSTSTIVKKKTIKQKSNMRQMSGNYYMLSSEISDYPDIDNIDASKLYLEVSINKQRTYLKTMNGKVLYEFYCSTGKDDSTPRGTYSIEQERGDHFYNESSNEGANYWTSWKDHGIYLFHSTPVDNNGNYIETDGQYIGKKAMSHGCVRMTVSDAKWLNEHIKFGTKVIVE